MWSVFISTIEENKDSTFELYAIVTLESDKTAPKAPLENSAHGLAKNITKEAWDATGFRFKYVQFSQPLKKFLCQCQSASRRNKRAVEMRASQSTLSTVHSSVESRPSISWMKTPVNNAHIWQWNTSIVMDACISHLMMKIWKWQLYAWHTTSATTLTSTSQYCQRLHRRLRDWKIYLQQRYVYDLLWSARAILMSGNF